MKKRNPNIFSSISFILGLLILILNDFFLKQSFPSTITGKLSDFSGLFIFPMFLTFLFPNNKRTVYISTFLAFILWKLPIADSFITSWNSFNIFNINRVIDYTDYFALIVLPLSYFHKPKSLNLPKRRIAINLIAAISFITFCSTAGTHGAIKGYEYSTSKKILENAILEVINENKSIKRPPLGLIDDYHNSGGYITISISAPEKYDYTFRFYGGEDHWKKSPKRSEIFICYANDNEGNGGSDGQGGVEWYRWGIKNKLTEYFEENFISKLDSKLSLKHISKE